MHYNHGLQWFFIYHTVGMLWTAEAILHLGFCASAGAVARWYFAAIGSPLLSPEDALRPDNRLSSPLLIFQTIGRTLRYSSGSLAIGALLVIPGRIFRFFLEHCLHQAQTDGRTKPELRRVAQCCLRCCLDCSTKYLQYISHNAYIYVAVHDLSFCEGAQQAFELTLRNIGQVCAVGHARTHAPPHGAPHALAPSRPRPSPRVRAPSRRHGTFHTLCVQVSVLTAGERLLLTMAKLAVACFCTSGAAIAMSVQFGAFSALDNTNGVRPPSLSRPPPTSCHRLLAPRLLPSPCLLCACSHPDAPPDPSPSLPPQALFFTFIITFCVADAWMAVYDSAVESIFLCYLVDQEENDGDVRPYYASPGLRKVRTTRAPHRSCQRSTHTHAPPAALPSGSSLASLLLDLSPRRVIAALALGSTWSDTAQRIRCRR